MTHFAEPGAQHFVVRRDAGRDLGREERERSSRAVAPRIARTSDRRPRTMVEVRTRVTRRIAMIFSTSAPISTWLPVMYSVKSRVIIGFRRGSDGVQGHQCPPDGGGKPHDDDRQRLEPERPDGDEEEDEEEGRCLEIEGGRLLVLEMEAPDEAVEERHVGEDEADLDQLGERPSIGHSQASQIDDQEQPDHVGNRFQLGDRVESLGRQQVQRP